MLFTLSGKQTASPCRVAPGAPGAEPPGNGACTAEPLGTVPSGPKATWVVFSFLPTPSARSVSSFVEKSLQSPWDSQALWLLPGFPGPLLIPDPHRGWAEAWPRAVCPQWSQCSRQRRCRAVWTPVPPASGSSLSLGWASCLGERCWQPWASPHSPDPVLALACGCLEPCGSWAWLLCCGTFGGRGMHVHAGAQFMGEGLREQGALGCVPDGWH